MHIHTFKIQSKQQDVPRVWECSQSEDWCDCQVDTSIATWQTTPASTKINDHWVRVESSNIWWWTVSPHQRLKINHILLPNAGHLAWLYHRNIWPGPIVINHNPEIGNLLISGLVHSVPFQHVSAESILFNQISATIGTGFVCDCFCTVAGVECYESRHFCWLETSAWFRLATTSQA